MVGGGAQLHLDVVCRLSFYLERRNPFGNERGAGSAGGDTFVPLTSAVSGSFRVRFANPDARTVGISADPGNSSSRSASAAERDGQAAGAADERILTAGESVVEGPDKIGSSPTTASAGVVAPLPACRIPT